MIRLKKLVAKVLIVTMLVSSQGLAVFAESIDDIVGAKNENTYTATASMSGIEIESSSDDESEMEEEPTATISDTEEYSEIATESEIEIEEYDALATESELEKTDSVATESDLDYSMEISTSSDIEESTFSEIAKESFDVISENKLFGTPLFGDSLPSTIWYGTYPQNDNTSSRKKEPIKWKVLAQDGSEALLVADKVLWQGTWYYNGGSGGEVEFKDSDAFDWLNNSFLDDAFNADEKAGIKSKTIDGGTGKCWLLSNDEAWNSAYFADDNARKVGPTSYCLTAGSMYTESGNVVWWTRSHSDMFGTIYKNAGTYINSKGQKSAGIKTQTQGYRPSMWIDLTKTNFKTSNNGFSFVSSMTDTEGAYWGGHTTLWQSLDKYQGGQQLPAQNCWDSVPSGKTLAGYKITGYPNVVMSIPVKQTGNITAKPIWKASNQSLINWNFGSGSCSSDNLPYMYTHGTACSLPAFNDIKNSITPPTHQEFKGWAFDGTTSTISQIPSTKTGNVTVIPLFGAAHYNIIWDLGTGDSAGHFKPTFATPSNYEYGIGLDLAPIGNEVVPPVGREFDHWEIGGTTVTAISTTDDSPVVIKAIYKNSQYNITWTLGGTYNWVSGYIATPSYTYSEGMQLPNKSKIDTGVGVELDYWIIRQVGKADIDHATSISKSSIGEVEVIAIYRTAIYEITWDFKIGTDEGRFRTGFATPSEYTYGVGVTLPPASDVIPPVGRKFDHWEIGGVSTASITTTDHGIKNVKAKYQNLKYGITWDLGSGTDEGHFESTYDKPIDYEFSVGIDLTTVSPHIVPAAGRAFDHWEIGGVATTSITAREINAKTVKAIYKNAKYGITWELNGATVTGAMPSEHEYGTRIDLPVTTDITPAAGEEFDYWVVNGTKATSISANYVGPVTVTLIYKSTIKHKINWNYGTGSNKWSFSGYDAPDEYIEGITLTLPDGSFVAPTSSKKSFDYFTVDGVRATEISSSSTNDVTVTAVLKGADDPERGSDRNSPPSGGNGSVTVNGSSSVFDVNLDYHLPSVDMMIMTPIGINDYDWIVGKDKVTGRTSYGLKVHKNALIAKVLMGNREYSKYYKDVDNGNIQVVNGVYAVEYLNQVCNFAFDKDGKMLTGFVLASRDSKQYGVDALTGKLSINASIGEGKYYFCDDNSNLNGVMLKPQMLVINNVQYIFDGLGRVINETALQTSVQSASHTLSGTTHASNALYYDPINNAWKYTFFDAKGNTVTSVTTFTAN